MPSKRLLPASGREIIRDEFSLRGERRPSVEQFVTLEAHLHNMLHANLLAVATELRQCLFIRKRYPGATIVHYRLVALGEDVPDARLRDALLHLRRSTHGDDEIGRAKEFTLKGRNVTALVKRKRDDRHRITDRLQPAVEGVQELRRIVSANVNVRIGNEHAPFQEVSVTRQYNSPRMRSGKDISLP